MTYHSLGESPSVISTPTSIFKQQMQFLSANNYRSMCLSEAINCLLEKKAFPEKTVIITFDDGYKNVYTDAFPILQDNGLTGTVFLISRYCGKLNHWPGQPPNIEPSALLSWPEIDEMQRFGIEFGAHTLTHPDLTRLTIKDAKEQIIRSKDEIQAHTGVPVKVFAYPYGHFNPEIKSIVSEYFDGACTTKLGKIEGSCDLHALKRVDMYYLLNITLFRRISTRAMDRYLGARHLLRELKGMLR